MANIAQTSNEIWYLTVLFALVVFVIGLFYPKEGNIIEVIRSLRKSQPTKLRRRRKARAH